MNSQEVFDKVVNHLRKQNTKAMNGSMCSYRGANGTKCAVGCLMEDNEYSPLFEGNDIYRILKRESIAPSLTQKLLPHLSLLERLQGIHDIDPVCKWEEEFKLTAKHFKLIYSEP